MAAITSQGTTLSIGGIDIAQIVSYSGLDGESAEVEVTNLASTAKEFIVGLEDFGNFSFEIISDPTDAGQEDLRDAKSAGTAPEFILETSAGKTATFNASVKSISYSGSVDDADKASVNLRVTGAAVWVIV